MGWAEIIKAVNSNIGVPLNKLIASTKDSLNTAITNAKSGVDTSITSAKNEIKTFVKNNGTSYPDITTDILKQSNEMTATGRGKVVLYLSSNNMCAAKVVVDSKTFSGFHVSGHTQVLTFEETLTITNKDTWDIYYAVQLMG